MTPSKESVVTRSDRDWRFFVLAVTGHKLFVFTALVAGAWFGLGTLGQTVAAWNVNEYVKLARDGYSAGTSGSAFYPLYPCLIRAGSELTGLHPVAMGLIISNIAGVMALFLFFRLVTDRYGAATARMALVSFLAFPGAIFFSLLYTESLFLLELMVVFRALQKDRPGWAVPAAFLMPLTRPIGSFIGAVVLCHAAMSLIQQGRENDSAEENFSRRIRRNPGVRWLGVLVFPPAGLLLYLGLMAHWTGDAFDGFKAQRFYPYSPSVETIFTIRKWGGAFLEWKSLHGVMDSVVDRMFFLLFLGALLWVWRMDRVYFVWAICAGLIPPLANCFVSYSRYVMMVFPLFIVLAVSFQRRSGWIRAYYIVLLLLLQFYFLVLFANRQWAG